VCKIDNFNKEALPMSRVRLEWLVIAAMFAMPAKVSTICQTYGADTEDDRPLNSHIDSISLFKNGLAVVRRTAQVPTSGTYLLDDVPSPVHGTYWVESDARITTRLSHRLVEVAEDLGNGSDYQVEFAGKEVAIHFAEHGLPAVTGTVVTIDESGRQRRENPYTNGSAYGDVYLSRRAIDPASRRMLVVKTARGRSYVDTSRIAHLEVLGDAPVPRKRKAVLLFEVQTPGPATISITYLAKGMAWVPSYRVDISDAKTLTLRQKAVVRNEMMAIENADIHLISGYPSIEFAHVNAPLSPDSTWATFFRQLNQSSGSNHSILSNVLSQQAISTHASGQGGDVLGVIPTGDGVDLHYQPIGKQTLDVGDSIVLETATGRANYQRIVEWIVPDTRNANGHYVSEHEQRQDPAKFQDGTWDAIRFRNPLDHPMTTAPAMVVSGNHFNGQQTSFWVNAGEETTLHVTKALSVRTHSVEHEEPNEREYIHVGGVQYRRTMVSGELAATNHRNETIQLVVRRRFSGDLIEADYSPSSKLLEEGAWSANKRNQLTWTLKLDPGKHVKLSYQYAVLVRH